MGIVRRAYVSRGAPINAVVFMVAVLLHITNSATAWGEPAAQTPPGWRQIGTVPVDLLAATASDGLIVKSASPHLFLWKEKAHAMTRLTSLESSRADFTLSPSGKWLLVKDSTYASSLATYQLNAWDLERDPLSASRVPENRETTSLPIFAPDDSISFFNSPASKPGWNFPLSEYLWDFAHGVAQPTGFYLTRLPEFNFTNPVRAGVYSPEGARMAVILGQITITRTEPISRFGVFNPDALNQLSSNSGNRIAILDLKTGESKQLDLTQPVQNIFWPSDNEILITNPNLGLISRFNIREEKWEHISPLGPVQTLEISSDGKFAFYGPVREKNAHVILDLKSLATYEIQGAQNGVFSKDGTRIFLSRSTTGKAKPFVRVEMAPYRNSLAKKQIHIGNGDSLPGFGDGVPVWEVPHGKESFANNIELINISLNPLDEYGWDVYVTIRNKGNYFLGFDTKKRFGLSCELLDDKDKVVSAWTPDDEHIQPPAKVRLAPGESVRVDCGAVSSNALPPTFSGKIRYRIREYESETASEITVP